MVIFSKGNVISIFKLMFPLRGAPLLCHNRLSFPFHEAIVNKAIQNHEYH